MFQNYVPEGRAWHVDTHRVINGNSEHAVYTTSTVNVQSGSFTSFCETGWCPRSQENHILLQNLTPGSIHTKKKKCLMWGVSNTEAYFTQMWQIPLIHWSLCSCFTEYVLDFHLWNLQSTCVSSGPKFAQRQKSHTFRSRDYDSHTPLLITENTLQLELNSVMCAGRLSCWRYK